MSARRSWRRMEPWSAIAFARDWQPAARLQNAPSWHYVTPISGGTSVFHGLSHRAASAGRIAGAGGHTMDLQVRAVRNGWLPFYPQFNRNSWSWSKEAEAAGARATRRS
jgi:nitrate reductase / nitrite oxidoreductase, alpha subunit